MIVDDIGPPPEGTGGWSQRGSRVAGLTRGTMATAPSVCHECVWWQSRGNRTASKERWIERVEEESGEWGTIYYDDDGSVLGSMQYGPRRLLPPGRRPSGGATVGRRGARDLCVPDRRRRRVGREVALSRSDRRGPRPGRKGARGVRVPLSRARDHNGAVPRPSHGVPARLPRGLRLRDRPHPGKSRAVPARALRVSRRSRKAGGPRCSGSSRRRSSPPARRSRRRAPLYRQVAVPASRNVPPWTGRNIQP